MKNRSMRLGSSARLGACVGLSLLGLLGGGVLAQEKTAVAGGTCYDVSQIEGEPLQDALREDGGVVVSKWLENTNSVGYEIFRVGQPPVPIPAPPVPAIAQGGFATHLFDGVVGTFVVGSQAFTRSDTGEENRIGLVYDTVTRRYTQVAFPGATETSLYQPGSVKMGNKDGYVAGEAFIPDGGADRGGKSFEFALRLQRGRSAVYLLPSVSRQDDPERIHWDGTTVSSDGGWFSVQGQLMYNVNNREIRRYDRRAPFAAEEINASYVRAVGPGANMIYTAARVQRNGRRESLYGALKWLNGRYIPVQLPSSFVVIRASSDPRKVVGIELLDNQDNSDNLKAALLNPETLAITRLEDHLCPRQALPNYNTGVDINARGQILVRSKKRVDTDNDGQVDSGFFAYFLLTPRLTTTGPE